MSCTSTLSSRRVRSFAAFADAGPIATSAAAVTRCVPRCSTKFSRVTNCSNYFAIASCPCWQRPLRLADGEIQRACNGLVVIRWTQLCCVPSPSDRTLFLGHRFELHAELVFS